MTFITFIATDKVLIISGTDTYVTFRVILAKKDVLLMTKNYIYYTVLLDPVEILDETSKSLKG